MITSSIFCFSYVFEGGGLASAESTRPAVIERCASQAACASALRMKSGIRVDGTFQGMPVFEVEIVDAFLAAKAAFAKFRS